MSENAPTPTIAGRSRIEERLVGRNPWGLPLFLLLLCIVATIAGWAMHRQAKASQNLAEFHRRTQSIEHSLVSKLSHCESVLLGGAGLFNAAGEVSRTQWATYVQALRHEAHLAGVQGVGFAEWVPAGTLQSHVGRMRAEGFADYAISPAYPRDEYSSIVYLEPFTGRNLRAFGYDMFSEPVRRQAMERARDRGLPALSGRVVLVQEIPGEVQQAGFLIYVPVYARGLPTDTAEARRRALRGWVYSPFRVGDFMASLQSLKETGLALHIHDGGPEPQEIYLFDSREPGTGRRTPAFSHFAEIEVLGRRWTLHFESLPELESALDVGGASSWLLLFLGVLACVSTGGGTMLLLRRHLAALGREASLAVELQHEHELLEVRVVERTEALQRSEQRLRDIFASMAEGMLLLDAQGIVIDCNDAACRHSAHAREALLGRPVEEAFSAAINPDGSPLGGKGLPFLDAVRLGLRRERVEFGVRADGGLTNWFIGCSVPLRDVGGEISRVIVTFTDVTTLRSAEEEVRMLSSLLPVCAWCKKVRNDSGYWESVDAYLTSRVRCTHGMCPECAKVFIGKQGE